LLAKKKQAYPDFYVNSKLKWIIELARDGKSVKAHVDKFVTGIYKSLRKEMNKIVILEFRSNKMKIRKENYEVDVWRALYSDDYQTITLCRPNQSDKTIEVRGDFDRLGIADHSSHLKLT